MSNLTVVVKSVLKDKGPQQFKIPDVDHNMTNWCIENNIPFNCEWVSESVDNDIQFTFATPENAALFKLTWV